MPNDTFATVSNKTRRCRSTYQIRVCRVRQGVENGKEPERGSYVYHALPAKPKGAGHGRAG